MRSANPTSTARWWRTLRLLPVAALAWIVAGVITVIPEAAQVTALCGWIAAFAILGALVLRTRSRDGTRGDGAMRALVVAIVSVAAGAAVASHVALAQPDRDAALARGLGGGRAIAVHARVVGKVENRAGELAFDAVAFQIDAGSTSHPLDVPVAIRVAPALVDRPDALDVGSAVTARGTAWATRPGQREVLGVSAGRGVEVDEPPDGVLAAASDLRRGLLSAVRGLPEPGAGLVPGLAVGDTSAVDPALDAEMKASSLSHLTAVSGANCAIVVGLAFAAAALAGLRRSLRVVAGLTALTGFVVLVTPEPSVVRAAAMAAIAMLSVQLGRPAAGMSILTLAVTVLLVGDPWLAGSLGFALSTAATASLLLFARPLAVGLSRHLPRGLALALSVPLAAQLACGPLLVLITPTVPLYGVVANLLAAPAAPVATIVGLAACLTVGVPLLQSGLAAIAWLPASWIAATASTTTALPGGQVPWLEGWAGVAVLATVGIAIGVIVIGRGALRSRARPLHAISIALLSAVIGVTAGTAALTSVAGRWTLPQDWSILACDVGQGDAVLIRSGTSYALIDTGPAPEPLARCLSRLGIGHLDLLVLTHYDKDHAGGVAAVRGMVGAVIYGPPASQANQAVVDGLRAGGAETTAGALGMHGTLGAAEWRVLWPRPPALSRAFPAGNDACVVLEVRGSGMPTAIFLGDMSESSQAALAASGVLLPAYDVVKVAHHGSADQDPRLYAAIHAAVAVISVGAGNDYGHPRSVTLAFLQELGCVIARTDQSGIVAVSRTDAGVGVWRERAPPPVGTAQ
ncbi:ComEC/Rec2 family competence protein [Microbacterium rhizomatis]|uniref:ComEC/Rec2 family competence protein n=1 Tax=Microbacterium rhizomatis TaxID=1631477 RepID=A0A5J5J344_9MICO|nr:ComEC/Rec2 family competence protein [Microbacterium rhizomatis]KAA9110450.1 ComEC/Rec2 family competence protein [Microbacterium rhizomatis]